MDERLIHKLLHMQDAARHACVFIDRMTKPEFMDDARTQDACCMNLIVIGEATKHIMERWPDFVVQHPDFGWNRMTGMRNRIAHGYDQINFDIVWDTLVGELPKLSARLDVLLNTQSPLKSSR
jgi:uncharacterized protein with HEPN domain